MSFGRSLELYFVDGRPDGMLTAQVFNWTGIVLRSPRTQLREAVARREAGYTGVYVLLGERDGLPLAYIGDSLFRVAVGFGLLAPPVGLNVYVVNGMAKDIPIAESYRGVMPFLISDTLRTLLLLFFPAISLWLVRFIG